MQFNKLFDDDRAVSPVIGVILMVAITVILAAVIGTFVLGLGDQVQQTTPQASFGFDVEGAELTITHESGDSIDSSNLEVIFSGSVDESVDSGDTWSTIQSPDDGTVSAGDSITLTQSTGGNWDDDTARIVFNSPDSDNTATLATFEG